jgi:hypothetical protein
MNYYGENRLGDRYPDVEPKARYNYERGPQVLLLRGVADPEEGPKSRGRSSRASPGSHAARSTGSTGWAVHTATCARNSGASLPRKNVWQVGVDGRRDPGRREPGSSLLALWPRPRRVHSGRELAGDTGRGRTLDGIGPATKSPGETAGTGANRQRSRPSLVSPGTGQPDTAKYRAMAEGELRLTLREQVAQAALS